MLAAFSLVWLFSPGGERTPSASSADDIDRCPYLRDLNFYRLRIFNLFSFLLPPIQYEKFKSDLVGKWYPIAHLRIEYETLYHVTVTWCTFLSAEGVFLHINLHLIKLESWFNLQCVVKDYQSSSSHISAMWLNFLFLLNLHITCDQIDQSALNKKWKTVGSL